MVEKEAAASEDGELDLTPGTLEKTNDPVRMYLREMGTVPLLTREGEVTIAKRIERGQLAGPEDDHARSADRLKELLQVGEDLRNGVALDQGNRSVRRRRADRRKDRSNKTKETLKHIDKIAKLYDYWR